MNTPVFRLYNQFHSSLFDLIEGNDETRQTKGLGVVLSKSPIFLNKFLNLSKIKSNIALEKIEAYDRIIINCELLSKGDKKRIDVLIRFYKNGKLDKAIVIEAKTISKSIDFFSTREQLNAYVDNYFADIFSGLENKGENVLKIALTKYENTENRDKTISMSWDSIMEILYNINPDNSLETQLCRDYFNFLIKINGTMKFYEEEVYSIPSASWSQELIEKHKIYECLNQGRYIIKKKPLYITFRKSGGGEMEVLYKIDDIIILKPKSDLDSFMESEYEKSKQDRIKAYCKWMTDNGYWKNGLPDDERQFIILSDDNEKEKKNENIKLKEPYPKPPRNNSFRAYYTLSEILNNTVGEGKHEEK